MAYLLTTSLCLLWFCVGYYVGLIVGETAVVDHISGRDHGEAWENSTA